MKTGQRGAGMIVKVIYRRQIGCTDVGYFGVKARLRHRPARGSYRLEARGQK